MSLPNFGKDPIRVAHASLERANDESVFRSKCPACEKGVLFVARSQKTFNLLREDACVGCGQRFIYTDQQIAGTTLEPEKEQPS